MLVGSTNQVFFKAFTQAYMNATCVLENKNPSCCCDGPTLPPISEGQCPTSGCKKIAIFQSDCSPIHDLVTSLYWALKSVLG